MTRIRTLLVLSCCLGLASGEAEALRERGDRLAALLLATQSDDGTWGSERYPMFRSGQVLTPVILRALWRWREAGGAVDPDALAAGMAAVRRRIHDDGSVGHDDPDLLEYPTYAAAASLACLRRGGDEDAESRARLVAHLLRVQLAEHHGFGEDHVAHGSWGFRAPLAPGRALHADISHTRYVLEALSGIEGEEVAAARRRAERFLAVCQKLPRGGLPQPIGHPGDGHDGGFYYSPVVVSANKGGFHDRERRAYASYAPPTADGLLALRAIGVADDDERLVAARRWLRAYEGWRLPAGIPIDRPEPWHLAIRCYHLCVGARAFAAIDADGDWRSRMLAAIDELPRTEEGLVHNPPGFLMKEDDPLIATPLVLEALAAAVP